MISFRLALYMDAHDPWTILAEQGIHIRPAAAYAGSWEYTLPALSPIWYGPYVTREEALRAALRYLLSQAQSMSSRPEQVTMTNLTTELPSDDRAAQLAILQRQLAELLKARAALGIMSAADLEPRIEQVREQIRRLKERMAQPGEE